ncbi:MAG: hypothetical protein IJJ84_10430 [Kiritimatiellae bacterium]|nr:hypothetical protein [Kiritimatiellia bacterium]
MTELDKKLAKAARECGAVVLMVATSATLPLLAGVKYWDNPAFRAFDVGDYASGAVWHFDGIRNVGANQPHSTTATTWKNIGSSGSSNDVWIRYRNAAGNGWANSSAPASLGVVDGRNLGSWTENGFVLTGDSEWRTGSGSISTGTDYTLQMVVEATVIGQAVNFPYFMSVNASVFAFNMDKAAYKLNWTTQSTSGPYPFMSGTAFSYITAIINSSDNTATFFDGTTPPTSGNGFKQYDSVIGRNETGYCIGGSTSAGNCMAGTIHAYRYYKRVLTHEELMWNRVVDEARFFGRRAPLPATNVVVTANWPRVGGFQPNGHYYVDSGDFTITAPASTNIYGRAYTCTGYTLETWDDATGTWSAPVSSDSRSYTFTYPSAKVRLTWQWTAGDGLVTYDLDDYVWDGLVWFYDGIRNVGRNRPHDTTSLDWKNLGSSGAYNDLFLQRSNAAGTSWLTAGSLDIADGWDPGRWTDDGFTFIGKSRFRSVVPVAFGTSYTFQAFVRASSGYMLSARAVDCSIFVASDGSLRWNIQTNETPPRIAGALPHTGYVTAILDDTDLTAKFFDGITPPAEGVGFKQFDSLDLFSDTAYSIGGAYDPPTGLNGTIKFFRYYDRVLTDEELAWNRQVDNYRYFGPPVTNVIVATTNPNLHGNEAEGAYEVVGSHTFTAPATLTAKGITYTNDGYTVETWDGSAWTACAAHAGTSYVYTTAAGKVRLTWKWKATHGLRTAADYAFDDYSQAGLIWNYDGILNIGVEKSHSTNTTTWVNLGSAGAICNLVRYKMAEGDLGEWKDDGYEFRGYTRFRAGSAVVGPVKGHTMQILLDADVNSQGKDSTYAASVMWDAMSIGLCKSTSKPLFWFTQSQNRLLVDDSTSYDYATALFDYDAKTAAFFSGTTPPTSGIGFKQFSSVTARNTTGYGLGCTSTASDALTGIVKMFRCYDRALTQEEIVRNRNADAARYYGALATTNVLVAAGGGVQAETGACKVEGSWTFTATSVAKEDGQLTPVTRYTVERLVNGAWTDATWHDGASYTYVEGTEPESVRLTWHGRPEGAVILVR